MKLLPLVALLVAPHITHSQEPPSVQTMLPACEALLHSDANSPPNEFDQAICIGFAVGVSWVTSLNCLTRQDGYRPADFASASPPPTNLATVQAYVNWARANPQRWGDPFDEAMLIAIVETFPCEN